MSQLPESPELFSPPTGYSYQWLRDGTNISGATASTYVIVTADSGHSLSCRVTASNSGGSTPATSNSIAITAIPVNTVAPAISGTLTVGSTLTVSNGTWTNSPTSYAYQWQRDGANIAGANAATYVIASTDTGHNLSAVVTATNAGGSAPMPSNSVNIPATAGVPTDTVLPAVTGTTTIGSVLTCSTGTWTGSPTGYNYQWLRDGANITGATASTYVIASADSGHNLSCNVIAINAVGSSAPATSNSVAIVTVPANTVLPAVTGATSLGSTLTCSTGTWTGSPTSYAYQWLRDGANITGSTAATYVIASADLGHNLTCSVTATNAVGSSAPVTSNSISVPSSTAPTITVAPSVTGTTTVGSTLTSTTGTWTGSPTGYTYQWFQDAATITGATAATYVIATTDQGHNLSCHVTATNAGGSNTAISNSVSVGATALPANASHDLTAPPLTAPAGGRAPYQFGQIWRMTDVPTGNWAYPTDNSNNPLTYQIDEVSPAWPDNSQKHCVYNVWAPVSTSASNASQRIKYVKTSGTYAPASTRPVTATTAPDITTGRAFRAHFYNVVTAPKAWGNVDLGNNSGTGTLTGTVTATNRTNRIMIVAVVGDVVGGADDVSVTCGGVAMTLAAKWTGTTAGLRFLYVFYLIAPVSGPNTISVSSTASHYLAATAVEYAGVVQVSPVDTTVTNQETSTAASSSLTTSVTVGTANSFVIIAVDVNAGVNSSNSQGAGAGLFSRRPAARSYDSPWVYDSGVLLPTGAQSFTTNVSNGYGSGPTAMAHVAVSFKTSGLWIPSSTWDFTWSTKGAHSGNFTFDLNTAIAAGQFRAIKNGPVCLEIYAWGYMADDGGGTDPHLYCEYWCTAYVDPANTANILYYKHIVKIGQPIVNPTNPTIDVCMGICSLYDGGTTKLRDLADDSFFIGPSNITANAPVQPPPWSFTAPHTVYGSASYQIQLQSGSTMPLGMTDGMRGMIFTDWGLSATGFEFMAAPNTGGTSIWLGSAAAPNQYRVIPTSVGTGPATASLRFAAQALCPYYSSFYITADNTGAAILSPGTWANPVRLLPNLDATTNDTSVNSQKAYWIQSGAITAWDITLGGSVTPLYSAVYGVNLTNSYTPGNNNVHRQGIDSPGGGYETNGVFHEFDARWFVRMGATNWTTTDHILSWISALTNASLPNVARLRDPGGGGLPRVVPLDNGPSPYTGGSYPVLGSPTPNDFWYLDDGGNQRNSDSNWPIPPNISGPTTWAYGVWGFHVSNYHWVAMGIISYMIFGERFMVDDIRRSANTCIFGPLSTRNPLVSVQGVTHYGCIDSGFAQGEVICILVAAAALGLASDPEITYFQSIVDQNYRYQNVLYGNGGAGGLPAYAPGYIAIGWTAPGHTYNQFDFNWEYSAVACAWCKMFYRHPLSDQQLKMFATLEAGFWDCPGANPATASGHGTWGFSVYHGAGAYYRSIGGTNLNESIYTGQQYGVSVFPVDGAILCNSAGVFDYSQSVFHYGSSLLNNGDIVLWTRGGQNPIPSEFQPPNYADATPFYIVNNNFTALTFQLSATPGGAPIVTHSVTSPTNCYQQGPMNIRCQVDIAGQYAQSGGGLVHNNYGLLKTAFLVEAWRANAMVDPTYNPNLHQAMLVSMYRSYLGTSPVNPGDASYTTMTAPGAAYTRSSQVPTIPIFPALGQGPGTVSIALNVVTPTLEDNALAGTLLATAVVTMSDGSQFHGTLTSSNSFFAISGLNIVTARAVTSADRGTQSTTITATAQYGQTFSVDFAV